MTKLFRKKEILFAIVWIVVYVVGSSVADSLSEAAGLEKSITLIFDAVLCITAVLWIKENNLSEYFGLCKSAAEPKKFLYYIPLAVLASCNLWFGAAMNYSALETLLFAASMLCVGFLEELIFRGFLFKAMARDNVRSAIIVSSLTFGIGHIVNLINGSGAGLIPNLCQVCYAVAIGFLFVTIFYKGKSLVPCIVTHGVLNSLSVFSSEAAQKLDNIIVVSLILCAVSVAYALWLIKTLPEKE